MEFKQHINVRQFLDQRLVMTPHLQQAIRLLQLSRTELAESIAEELERNPALEEVPASDLPGESPTPITAGEGQVADFEAPGDQAAGHEIDWRDWLTDLRRAPSEGAGTYRDTDDERPGFDQTLTRASTLAEHLEDQLATAGLPLTVLRAAVEIIGNLDDDGYFRPSRLTITGGPEGVRRALLRRIAAQGHEVAEVAGGFAVFWLDDLAVDVWLREASPLGCDVDVEEGSSIDAIGRAAEVDRATVLAAIAAVQALDPVGVACRDLRSCLLAQVDALHPGDAKLRRLVDLHLPNIEARDAAAIRRDLRCGEDEFERLLSALRALEPRPGRRFSGEAARYITPDVLVYKVGDDYTVVLNDDGLPKLRIAGYVEKALAEDAGGPQRAETREYLHEKLRSATWLIRSIHQRQSTIQRVTEAIMKFQRPFLDGGREKLRPLVLREIAEAVELSESTVSRVTTNKYVHTPQGIYELKFFFGARISAQGQGDDVAAEAVRLAVKRLIERENPNAPLSDQEITEILQGGWDRGRMLARLAGTEAQIDALRPAAPVSIARRTVAKYRELLGIESSSRRKRVF